MHSGRQVPLLLIGFYAACYQKWSIFFNHNCLQFYFIFQRRLYGCYYDPDTLSSLLLLITVEKSAVLTDWKVQCYRYIVMLTDLWNMIFNLHADGFIQRPLGKLVHHEMTFRSSNFLLQQVPASMEPMKQPNSLQWTTASRARTRTNLCCTRCSSACLLLPRTRWASSVSFKPTRFNWCQRSSKMGSERTWEHQRRMFS